MAERKKIQSEISSLVQEIQALDHHYYVLDDPIASDAEYDRKLKKLQELEQKYPELALEDSPTQRVSGQPLEKFKKIRHRQPMLSLANAMGEEEFIQFDERVKRLLEIESTKSLEYFCEVKFDGLSINLTYEKGILISAGTRGNGVEGEDVTLNVKTIKSVPLRLNTKKPPQLIEIRGEVIFPIEAFENLNREQLKKNQKVFSNPRNAAAGTIRQLDPKITAARPLQVFSYGIGEVQGIKIDSFEMFEQKLLEWGFRVGSYKKVCEGPNEVLNFYRELEKERDRLEYEIDGIVVKLNSFREIDQAGYISRNPRGMIALKFPARQETTRVTSIFVQVGRTGAITPVALVEPVNLGGAIVKRATLHNEDEIRRKDIRIGDKILIQRAGDVIPEVVHSISKLRTGKETIFKMPKTCPACHSKIEKKEGEAVYRCLNKKCPAKVIERYKHFISKGAMNFEGVGPSTVEVLVDEGWVHEFSDFFKLKKEDFLKLEGFKDKSSENAVRSIQSKREPDLDRLIYALGIRFVGTRTAKLLANEFRSMKPLFEVTENDLIEIPDIGPEVAKSVCAFFHDDESIQEVKNLLKVVKPKLPPKISEQAALKAKIFVLTGSLPTLSRSEATQLIETHGGKVSGSVSKKTDFVLAGEAAGSKYEKAVKLGVKIITEDEFRSMLQ